MPHFALRILLAASAAHLRTVPFSFSHCSLSISSLLMVLCLLVETSFGVAALAPALHRKFSLVSAFALEQEKALRS